MRRGYLSQRLGNQRRLIGVNNDADDNAPKQSRWEAYLRDYHPNRNLIRFDGEATVRWLLSAMLRLIRHLVIGNWKKKKKTQTNQSAISFVFFRNATVIEGRMGWTLVSLFFPLTDSRHPPPSYIPVNNTEASRMFSSCNRAPHLVGFSFE